MPKLTKRRSRAKGGQPGNQNARKHGFYSEVLSTAEQVDLNFALDVEGIDMEIAVLRVKIKAILEEDPDNIRLIMEATNTLARLLRTKYNLDKGQGKSLKDALSSVMRDLAVPIGIGIGVGGLATK